MKPLRLTVLLILVAIAVWTGAQSGQAAPPDLEQSNQPSGYVQEASTPTAVPANPVSTGIAEATQTPQPTHSPVATPPPSDPDTTSLIVLFGVLLGVIILFGMGINSRRIF